MLIPVTLCDYQSYSDREREQKSPNFPIGNLMFLDGKNLVRLEGSDCGVTGLGLLSVMLMLARLKATTITVLKQYASRRPNTLLHVMR
jgi:hypothetical protein